MHILKIERLAMEHWPLIHAREFPGGNIAEMLVIAQRLALGGLALFTE